MKILVITNLYPPHYIGGYELRCQTITESLRERGHEVRVLTSNHGLAPGASPLNEEEPGVERSLRVHGFYGHPWLPIGKLRGLEFHNHAVLRAAIADFAPDVVHVWNMGGISKSLTLTLQKLNVPTAYDISDHWIARSLVGDVWLRWWNLENAPLHHRALRQIWTLLGLRQSWQQKAPTNPLRHIDFRRVYFCSRALLNISLAKGYKVAHGAVIHCPVDIARFTGVPRTAAQPLKTLLYVGRFSEDKGVMTALKAMVALRDRPDLKLHLYGKGDADYEAMLRKFAADEKINVEFRSAGSAQMPEVYRTHDALLFTSEWEEPFALTPLEAMACGMPVIGTTTGGSIELLRHRENALTYEAGNAGQLAARVRELDAEPALREAMAARGYAEVRENFNQERIVSEVEDYLKQTVAHWTPAVLPEFAAE